MSKGNQMKILITEKELKTLSEVFKGFKYVNVFAEPKEKTKEEQEWDDLCARMFKEDKHYVSWIDEGGKCFDGVDMHYFPSNIHCKCGFEGSVKEFNKHYLENTTQEQRDWHKEYRSRLTGASMEITWYKRKKEGKENDI